MARLRTIKPGFFTNEYLADAGPEAMILFAGMWCIADREGRLEDRPSRIKVECLPYFDVDPNELLSRLESRRFITRYDVEGHKYIQINNFLKHQTPHIKERASTIPAPCLNGESTVVAPPVFGILSLGSGNLNTDLSDRRRSDLPAKSPRPKRPSPEGFKEFYVVYPRKEGRADAEKAWRQEGLETDIETRHRIMDRIPILKTQGCLRRNFVNGRSTIPMPGSFIRGKRWEDEVNNNGKEEDYESVPCGHCGAIGSCEHFPKKDQT